MFDPDGKDYIDAYHEAENEELGITDFVENAPQKEIKIEPVITNTRSNIVRRASDSLIKQYAPLGVKHITLTMHNGSVHTLLVS
jgi:hypothetical protein